MANELIPKHMPCLFIGVGFEWDVFVWFAISYDDVVKAFYWIETGNQTN